MIVDMKVALGRDLHIDQRMAGQLIEHMVEKADTGRDDIAASSVQRDGDLDACFFGFARDGRGAHRLLAEKTRRF